MEPVPKVPGGWLYRCDGMPTMRGCGEETIVSRKYLRTGLKSTGWLVCNGQNDDGSDDLEVALVFCPSCTLIVLEQGPK